MLSACPWLPCRHHALPPGRGVPTARACRLQHPKAGTWQSHVRHRAVGWWRISCFPQHLRKQDENLLSDSVRTHSLLEAPSHT